MLKLDQIEFKSLLEDFLRTWRADVDDFTFGTWWQALQRFELSAIKRVLTQFAANNDAKFPPRPAFVAKLLLSDNKALSVQSRCAECRDKNPVHRQAHWMDLDPESLAAHLQAEFSDYYQKGGDRLGYKLAEIADYRSRYTCKYADDYGQWLSPGQAYLQRMQVCEPIIGMAVGYEPPKKK